MIIKINKKHFFNKRGDTSINSAKLNMCNSIIQNKDLTSITCNASKASVHETCKTFNFNGTENMRVVLINNEPYFVAADVCSVLDHTNPSVAVLALDEDERVKIDSKLFLGVKI